MKLILNDQEKTKYYQDGLYPMAPNQGSGRTIYVAPNVDPLDPTADGSFDKPKAWTAVINRYGNDLVHGNTILLKAGVYRGQHWVESSWSSYELKQDRIYIGIVGDGEVIFDGSVTDKIVYTDKGNGIWELKLPSGYDNPQAFVMERNTHSCKRVWNQIDIVNDGDWWFDSNTKIVHMKTYSHPFTQRDLVYLAYNRDAESHTLFYRGMTHITFKGLTIRGAYRHGLCGWGHNIEVINCKFEHNLHSAFVSAYALGADPGHSSKFLYNKVVGNVMINHPRGKEYGTTGLWPASVAIARNNICKGNIIAESGGEGIGTRASNVLIEDNILYDNWSANIYPDSATNIVMRRNICYASNYDFKGITDGSYVGAGSDIARVKRYMTAIGILFGVELNTQPLKDSIAYDNIMVGCRYGLDWFSEVADGKLDNFKMYNNVMITPNHDGSSYSGAFTGMRFHNKGYINCDVKGNVVVSTLANHGKVSGVWDGSTDGLTLDQNYYSGQGIFVNAENEVSFNDWKSQTGWDGSSQEVNPLNRQDWANNVDFTINDASGSWNKIPIDDAQIDIDYGVNGQVSPNPDPEPILSSSSSSQSISTSSSISSSTSSETESSESSSSSSANQALTNEAMLNELKEIYEYVDPKLIGEDYKSYNNVVSAIFTLAIFWRKHKND